MAEEKNNKHKEDANAIKGWSFNQPKIKDESWHVLGDADRSAKAATDAWKMEKAEVAELRANYERLRKMYDEKKDRLDPHTRSKMTRRFNSLLKNVEERERLCEEHRPRRIVEPDKDSIWKQ